MVAVGLKPDLAYVRYAFCRSPDKPVYFYLAVGPGDTLHLADGHDAVVGWRQFLLDDQPDFDGFTVKLAGFETAVTTAPIKRNGVEMIDRVRALEWPTALGPFRIVFDWSGDPTDSKAET
jgi:hypothetical protein